MSDETIRNPKRKNEVILEKYESEYKRMGIIPNKMIHTGNYANQIATLISPSIRRGGSIAPPLVSNNVNSGSSTFPHTSSMIDNNEFVSFNTENVNPGSSYKEDPKQKTVEYMQDKSITPNVGEFILMIKGELVICGTISAVEDKARDVLYDNDLDYPNISSDDIIVLKRVSLKVGVHIKE